MHIRNLYDIWALDDALEEIEKLDKSNELYGLIFKSRILVKKGKLSEALKLANKIIKNNNNEVDELGGELPLPSRTQEGASCTSDFT